MPAGYKYVSTPNGQVSQLPSKTRAAATQANARLQ
jgi:hypothetical protein